MEFVDEEGKKITRSFTAQVNGIKDKKYHKTEMVKPLISRGKTTYKIKPSAQKSCWSSTKVLSFHRKGLDSIKEVNVEKPYSAKSSESSDRAVDLETENKKAVGVSEYATKLFQNDLYRAYMEDRVVCCDGINGPGTALFCVFDGHGGSSVVDLIQMKVIQIFKEKHKMLNNMKDCLSETISDLQETIMSEIEDAGEEGSTAVICYIANIKGKRKLFTANLGDSACFLVSSKEVSKLFEIHNCNNKDEVERVKKTGAKIIKKKIMGSLSVTRSLGDKDLMEDGLIQEPFITETDLTEDDKWLILATDGAYEKLSEEDLNLVLLAETQTSLEMIKRIHTKALERKTRDNIAIVVANLS